MQATIWIPKVTFPRLRTPKYTPSRILHQLHLVLYVADFSTIPPSPSHFELSSVAARGRSKHKNFLVQLINEWQEIARKMISCASIARILNFKPSPFQQVTISGCLGKARAPQTACSSRMPRIPTRINGAWVYKVESTRHLEHANSAMPSASCSRGEGQLQGRGRTGWKICSALPR